MKAAVIDSLERGPRFADFAEPVVTGGETLVEVTATGLHPIVRMLASGEHYGSQGMLPMIPGIDGTGRAPDGTRVYFGGVRAPWGPMAQRAAAGLTLPLPDGLDEVTAAAIVNPGVGAWLALTRRAMLQPGETVLVLGATGVSGRIAVVLAARMGAGRVIAAGRNQAILDRFGATATVTLGGPEAVANAPDATRVLDAVGLSAAYIAREAGRLGMAVHIHTGQGCGNYFDLAGARPTELESVLDDPDLRKTNFVLLHGGAGPYTHEVAVLLSKPNVYADFSEQDALLPARAESAVIREWLEWYPEKVLYGTDLAPGPPEQDWDVIGYSTDRTARRAGAGCATGAASRPTHQVDRGSLFG